MTFGSDFIDKVRDSNDIVEIVGQFTQLKAAGSNFTGLCPFPDHREKSPSFSVSQTKQVYYCFGCKKAGNIFTFVEHMQGLSFPEAVEYLAKKAGLSIPVTQQTQSQGRSAEQKTKLLIRICDYAKNVFKNSLVKLPPDHPVKIYLQGRNLSTETIERFEVGFAVDSWDYLAGAVFSKGIAAEPVCELGLIKARSNSQGHFDVFRNRLIFPILSVTGQTIGFGGRSLSNDPPKYLNSPDSSVFHKGKIFYGLHETAKFIRAQDQAIIVEGYTDFLSLYQAGIQNVVATLGTALTADHARLLKRYTKNVIILFDGDDAGQAAAERSAPILLHEGLYPRGFILPDQYDPDEFVRDHGAANLKLLLQSAPELFSILLKKHLKAYDGSQAEKLVIIDHLKPILLAVADVRLRDLYLGETAEWLRLEKKWVEKAIRHNGLKIASVEKRRLHDSLQASQDPSEPVLGVKDMDNKNMLETVIVVDKAPRAEVELLNLVLLEKEYLDDILASNVVSHFLNPGIREIFARVERIYRQMPNEFDKLSSLLAGQVKPASVMSLHLQKPMLEISKEGAKKLIFDCSRRVRESFLREKQKEIASHLRGLKSTDQLEQLERIMNIQRHRQALKNDPEIN